MESKKSAPGPRRIWRMSADAPMGEYLELVPKSAYEADDTAPPKRVFHPEVRDPIYQTSPITDRPASSVDNAARSSTSVGSMLERRAIPRQLPTPEPTSGERAEPPAARAKVLNPGQVPSWRASSYDLLTGLTVRDVTDTIPGEIFDELFRPEAAARPVRRRR